MALKVQKLKQSRIFQHVVDQIQEAILDGSLNPGETLPSEMKLKELFDTSRGTIREALRIIEQKGLIDIRTGAGGGATIRDMGTEKITEYLNMLLRYRKVSLHDISEFREGVEGIVAELAARKATPDDVDRLHEILSGIDHLREKDHAYWNDYIKIDIGFHLALADIAGNPVYIAVLQMIHQNILGPDTEFSEKDKSILMKNHRDLQGIIKAVEKHDGAEAKRLACMHITRFQDNIRDEYK